MKSTLETLSFGKLMNSDSPDLISILACWLLLLYSLFLNFPIHYFWLNYLPLDWFRATITSTDVLNLYTAQNHIKNVGGNKKFNLRIFHIFHNHYSSYLSLFITLITKWVWISRIRHILGTFWCSVNYIQVRNSIGRWNSPARVADIQEKFGILGRMEHRDKWQYMPKTFSLDAIFTWQTSKLLPDTSSNKKGKIHIHHFPAAFLKRRQKIFSM